MFTASIYLKYNILQLLFLGSFLILIYILLCTCDIITRPTGVHLVGIIVLLLLYSYKTVLYIFSVSFVSIFKLVNFRYIHSGVRFNCNPPTTVFYYIKLSKMYFQFTQYTVLNYAHYSLLPVNSLNYVNTSDYYNVSSIIQQSILICYPTTQNIYYLRGDIIGLQSSVYCNILNTYILFLFFIIGFALYIHYYFLTD